MTPEEQETLFHLRQWFLDCGQWIHDYRHFLVFTLFAYIAIVLWGRIDEWWQS